MDEKRRKELLKLALDLQAKFNAMTTDEVVAVLSKALGDNSPHVEAPYRMIWQVADAVNAEKVVIREKKKQPGKIEIQFCACKGGALNLIHPKEVEEVLA